MRPDIRVEVSIVIPCLNEALSIGDCVEQAIAAIEGASISGEVIVADNGSSDGSIEIAKASGARIAHVSERGYGNAVRGGVAAARGELVVLGDSDGQHNFLDVPRFVEKLREGSDLVLGNRFDGETLPGAMSWSHRYIGNPLLSGLVRFLFNLKVHDTQTGMRGITKSAFTDLDLRTTGFELCPEMVIKAARRHLTITEIPITVLPDRRERQAHLRTFPDGWRHLIFILMCSPNYLFIAPGLVFLGLGVALVGYLVEGPQQIVGVHLDTRTELFGVILASFGLQIVSIGLFARVFSYSDPMRVRSQSIERFLKNAKLEQGLALGAILILVGVVGDLFRIIPWINSGLHQLNGVRDIIFWSLWILLGLQISFASFFLSMVGISRGTWQSK